MPSKYQPGRITRHRKAVARLVSNGQANRPDQTQAALERIRQRARRLHKSEGKSFAVDWNELKRLRDRGRP